MWPVNYAIWFSQPVTSQPPRRFWDSVGASPNPSARYKDAFVPAAFLTALFISFPLFTLLHGPVVPSGLGKFHLLLQVPVPAKWYDAASEKSASARTPARNTPAAFSPTTRPCVYP